MKREYLFKVGALFVLALSVIVVPVNAQSGPALHERGTWSQPLPLPQAIDIAAGAIVHDGPTADAPTTEIVIWIITKKGMVVEYYPYRGSADNPYLIKYNAPIDFVLSNYWLPKSKPVKISASKDTGMPCVAMSSGNVFCMTNDAYSMFPWQKIDNWATRDIGLGSGDFDRGFEVWKVSYKGLELFFDDLWYTIPTDPPLFSPTAIANSSDEPHLPWIVSGNRTVWELVPGQGDLPFDSPVTIEARGTTKAKDIGVGPEEEAWIIGIKHAVPWPKYWPHQEQMVAEKDKRGWKSDALDSPDYFEPKGNAWNRYPTKRFPRADGNHIFRWDSESSDWEMIWPAWGRAIDVDAYGNPWVVDSKGRVYVRNAPVLGVFPNITEDVSTPPTPEQVWSEAHTSGMVMLIPWSSPAPDIIDIVEDTAAIHDQIEDIGTNQGYQILFTFAAIMTGASTVPGQPYDFTDFASQEVLNRFKQDFNLLADEQFRERVTYVSIGNEIDVFMRNHPQEIGGVLEPWASYVEFFSNAADHVRSVMPHARVGVTLTYEVFVDALLNNQVKSYLDQLKAASDVIIFNYYPLKGPCANGAIGTPWEPFCVQFSTACADESIFTPFGLDGQGFGGQTLPAFHINMMLEFAEGKPLVIQEVGYPSAEQLCSSKEKQALFIHQLFDAIYEESPRIAFVSWFSMNDYRRETGNPECQDLFTKAFLFSQNYCIPNQMTLEECVLAFYQDRLDAGCGIGDLMFISFGFTNLYEYDNFNAFLSTCGLRDYSQTTPHPSWYTFRNRAIDLGKQKPW